MSFMDRHRKVLAIITVVCFSYLMRIAAAPLKAETAQAQEQQAGSASAADQPGAIEKNAAAGYYAPKKSSPLIPILIGVVVVGAIAAVLILVVLKDKYDIQGTWYNEVIDSHHGDWWEYITFVGSRTSGIFTNDWGESGTYMVDGKNVTILYDYDTIHFTGTFIDKNIITGTYTGFCIDCWENFSGSMYLTRGGSVASTAKPGPSRETH